MFIFIYFVGKKNFCEEKFLVIFLSASGIGAGRVNILQYSVKYMCTKKKEAVKGIWKK